MIATVGGGVSLDIQEAEPECKERWESRDPQENKGRRRVRRTEGVKRRILARNKGEPLAQNR
jgi:hypothetical protein